MSTQNKTIIIVILGALVFFISLLSLSKTPPINQGAVDIKIATQLIEEGEIMKGVALLKEVLEKDESNIDAIWQLGKLSMQSSQYKKAIGRFENFVSLANGEDKVSGLIYLADAYFLSGDTKKSSETLARAKNLAKTDKILTEIDERIKIINKN